MASSLNRASLVGHLGADPEVRRTRDGAAIVNFSLATSESWTDRTSGEKRERTEWHRIVIFSEGLGRVAEQYLTKGSKCLVEGKIQTRKWQDQSGQDRYSTEIVLQGFDAKLLLLGSGGGDRSGASGSALANRPADAAPASPRTFSDDMDDEIPF